MSEKKVAKLTNARGIMYFASNGGIYAFPFGLTLEAGKDDEAIELVLSKLDKQYQSEELENGKVQVVYVGDDKPVEDKPADDTKKTVLDSLDAESESDKKPAKKTASK